MNAADQSYVKNFPGGTVFAGPDGVELFRAAALASGLGLYAKTGMVPNRAWSVTNMLALATHYTKKKYPKSKAGAKTAESDVRVFVQGLKASLPYLDQDGKPT